MRFSIRRASRAMQVRAWVQALEFALIAICASIASVYADVTDPLKPKLGPNAVTIQQSHEYLRTHEAPDYWALSPFYLPQVTDNACSLAAVAMLVNALRGLPPNSIDELVTQNSLLAAVGVQAWTDQTSEHGDGITFEELQTYVQLSLQAFDLDADVEVFKPDDSSPATLAELRRMLADNEQSASDVVLVYYNQGVVTGDWDGPHLSPVGAYDGVARRVLIMDVDRKFYIPYWTGDETLLEAMLRPAPEKEGKLAGETGGIVRVSLRPAGRAQ